MSNIHKPPVTVSPEEKKTRPVIYVIGGIGFWLAVWWISSALVDLPLLYPGPFRTLKALGLILGTGDLYVALGRSLLFAVTGFFAGGLAALILALLSARWEAFSGIMAPFWLLSASVPVAALAILLFLWLKPPVIPICLAGVVSFSWLYRYWLGVNRGGRSEWKECRKDYRIPLGAFVRYFVLWDEQEGAVQNVSAAASLALKAGIAGELLVLPDRTMGERLYEAKLYFAADELFALILLILLGGAVLKTAVRLLMKKSIACLTGHLFLSKSITGAFGSRKREERQGRKGIDISCQDLEGFEEWLSYAKMRGLNLPLHLKEGKVMDLTAPSGAGKTSFLRFLAESLSGDYSVAISSQSRTLAPGLSASDNLRLVGKKDSPYAFLAPFLDEDHRTCPASALSGGMQRRVQVARALWMEPEVLLLDEPYAEQDQEAIRRMERVLGDYAKDHVVILTGHP